MRSFQRSRRLFKLIWDCDKKLFVGMILLKLIESGVPIVNIYLTKLFVDAITDVVNGTASIGYCMLIFIVQTSFNLANMGLTKIDSYYQNKWTTIISFQIEKRIIDKATRIPLVHYDTHDFYNNLIRTSSGIGPRGIQLVMSILDIGKAIITLSGCIAILVSLHWGFIFAAVVFLMPSFLNNLLIGTRQYNLFITQTPDERFGMYLSAELKSKHMAKELRVFGHAGYLLSLWENTYKKINEQKFKLERKNQRSSFGIDVLSKGIDILIFGGLVLLIGVKQITVGSFMAYMQAVSSMQANLNVISFRMSQFYTESLYIEEFYKFMDMENEADDWAGHLRFPERLSEEIRVENLVFRYPESTRNALDHVSFTIKPGEKVAIVGDNGAGKSTLVKCLIRLYSHTSGTILYDNRDIKEYDMTDFRKHVSVIFQDYVRYFLSVSENIGISDTDNIRDFDRVRSAAMTAGADEFIEKLPEGYDTIVGGGYYGGAELSIGQWQRIALSRALFRDSQLIILDEPTSSMDPIAESQLLEKFLDITEGKTAIFVTHRLGSCRHVDKILVLKEGKLVEQGNHEELMRMNGEYAKMYKEQSKWYVQGKATAV